MDKINVLGTTYTVLTKTREEDPALENLVGYCDCSVKKIVILKPRDKDVPKSSPLDVEDEMMMYKETLRHELVHAFLHESGLADSCSWSKNEEMIDWIALQLPKMVKAMEGLI